MTERVKYYPPTHEVLIHFAQQLGDELGSDYADWEVVQGLVDSMTVIARVLANDLNRKFNAEFDKRIE